MGRRLVRASPAASTHASTVVWVFVRKWSVAFSTTTVCNPPIPLLVPESYVAVGGLAVFAFEYVTYSLKRIG
jgi:hypothetical protein